MGDRDPTPDTIGNAPTVESTPSDDDLGSAASLLRGLADAPGRPIEGPLRAGQRVAGKYEIDRAIGQGGMGVVYRARDVKLERDVAIKVGSAVSSAGLARSQREAQALARLSHPNVVVVYEVGEIDGRVFVAMELVAGGTARAWAKARPRTPRELVALYAAAGDGLAAAHAAGIVHRDFKPDNVLVGADGRPRVADFGLAAAAGTRGADVAGTPAYMAPEQRDGKDVDARADQFAFCAALWEALTGERPRGDGAPARKIPRHVELALRRGLRVDPAARWSSMAPLLVELRRDPAARRRRIAIGLAAVGAVAAALIVPRALATSPDTCTDGLAQIAAAWGPARADRVRGAFAAIDRPWAARAGDRAIAALDDRARRWTVAYRRVCKESFAWNALMRGRTTRCLDRSRAAIAASAEVIGATDVSVASHVDDAIASLPDPDACADLAKMSRYADPPRDPARARASVAIDGVIDRARALGDAGHSGIAIALLPSLAALAGSIDDPSVRGEALAIEGYYLLGRSETKRAIELLREAYFIGRDQDDDELTAVASRHLADALIFGGDLEHADDWARIALADVRHTGQRAQEAEVLDALATLALRREDLDTARRFADRAVVLARAVGASAPIADALASRAPILGEAGDHRGEIADYRAALAAVAGHLGDDHPSTLEVRSQLGWALGEDGQYDEAIAVEHHTIAIAEANPSPDTRAVLADATAALGGIMLDAGHAGDSLPVLDRAIALLVAIEGRSGDVASAMHNRGNALLDLGRADDAIGAYRDSLEIATRESDAYLIASLQDDLSRAYLSKGDLTAAEKEARAAVENWRHLGVDPVRAAHARGALADVLAARGDPGADALYAQAIDETRATQAPRGQIGRLELRRARALAKRGDRARAISFITAARDDALDDAALAAECDAFLRELR